MKIHLFACLLLLSVTTAHCLCMGGYTQCPDGENLIIDRGTSWTCCDQTRHCSGANENGLIFRRYATIYKYTHYSPIGNHTYFCTSAPFSDRDTNPCLSCPVIAE